MQAVDHDNIVRMYGVVLDKENSLMLVSRNFFALKDPLLVKKERRDANLRLRKTRKALATLF